MQLSRLVALEIELGNSGQAKSFDDIATELLHIGAYR